MTVKILDTRTSNLEKFNLKLCTSVCVCLGVVLCLGCRGWGRVGGGGMIIGDAMS